MSYKLLNSMEQGPLCEGKTSSSGLKIPRILWNLKVNYRATRPYPEPVQSSPCLPESPIP